MAKSYVEMLKSQKLNKTYYPDVSINKPTNVDQSNVGKKWTEEEENKLLEELNKNIDIETISKIHKRKIGGIESRQKEIAYKMYMKNVSIDKIILKTKLDYQSIKQIIDSKQSVNTRLRPRPRCHNFKHPVLLETDMIEIKNEIKDLKKSISELSDMMKAVYEFEKM
uniref:Uncharacterized protein n=1 Tax=viral metagenome TaxID=1070528 RepID=A0A6C0JNU3_9ZZZZ